MMDKIRDALVKYELYIIIGAYALLFVFLIYSLSGK